MTAHPAVSQPMVYLTGMNRIRHFFGQEAPASRPYFILPEHDDMTALYRSIGTGMMRKPPKFRLLNMSVQTQGIVGVVTAVVAAACGGLVASPAGSIATWATAALTFLGTLVAFYVYWQRSLADLRAAIRPINPTPPEQVHQVAW